MVVGDLDDGGVPGGRPELVADFGEWGLWALWDMVNWRTLHFSNVEAITLGRFH
jgi:hypothetical protein